MIPEIVGEYVFVRNTLPPLEVPVVGMQSSCDAGIHLCELFLAYR